MLGQHVEPFTQIPLQHWPLQHCWNPEQQCPPQTCAASSQHSAPPMHFCGAGQQVFPQRSRMVQHCWLLPQSCEPLQHVVPLPHSGPASGAQQRLVFRSTQCWPWPQKKFFVDDGVPGSLQHSCPGGAQ